MPTISLDFDDDEYKLLKKATQTQGISIEEFTRLSVNKDLVVLQTKPWMRFVGFVASGDSTSSQRIDEVVYRGEN